MRNNLVSLLSAAAALAIAAPAAATVYTPATSVTYDYIHGPYTISDSGPDVLNVGPGASFTVSGDWSSSQTDDSYCPGCVIQLYLAGLPGLPGQADLVSSEGITASGGYSQMFTAPTTLGTYYIGGTYSLQFEFVPVSGGANGDGLVNYQINVVPEPSTWAMLMLGFAGLGYAGFRRTKSLTAV